MVQRAGASALLLVTLVLPILLAGCHDLTGDDAPAPVPAEPASPLPEPAAPPGLDPLPPHRIALDIDGTQAALFVHIDGDAATIAHHDVDWGDGTVLAARPGAPATRYTHEYEPPRGWRDDPRAYQVAVTTYSTLGHQRVARATAEIPPPPNEPPEAHLAQLGPPAAVPARTILQMTSDDPDGTIERWTLDLGDGSPPIQDHESPPGSLQHTYRQMGTHTATLTVEDDAGATTRATATVTVLPPQDHDLWTLSPGNATLYRHDPNGTLADTHTPFGTCYGPSCTRVLDAAANGQTLILLTDGESGSAVTIIDGTSGHARSMPVPGRAEGVHAAPDGRYWTTHRDGTITWFRDTDARPQGSVTVPAVDAETRLAFARDGTTWALVTDTVGRLHRIQPAEGRTDLLTVPIPGNPKHLALNDKHTVAVVLDDQGRAWVATPTLWGPLVSRLIQTDGTGPVGLACPSGSDKCWAAFTGPEPHLVAIDVRPDALAVATPVPVPLPEDTLPEGLYDSGDRLLVPTRGADPQTLILDDADGRLLGQVAALVTDVPRVHPSHPDLVYHLGPDGRVGILDVGTFKVVHRGPPSAGEAGPYLVAHPWQPGR